MPHESAFENAKRTIIRIIAVREFSDLIDAGTITESETIETLYAYMSANPGLTCEAAARNVRTALLSWLERRALDPLQNIGQYTTREVG